MKRQDFQIVQSRRSFFRESVGGVGVAALAHLLGVEGRLGAAQGANPLAPRKPHYQAKAKNIIFLFMEGGPSQIDLFDPKPVLQKWHGTPLPASITKDMRLAFTRPDASVLASPRKFQPHGDCGTEFSDWLPHTAAQADEICLIRSMRTDAFNHHPGQLLLFSGTQLFGRPTVGAWVTYGLGSESENLPGFVVLTSGRGTSGGVTNWSSGFLPSSYQGVVFRNAGDPILYLSNPEGVSRETQRIALDAAGELNRAHQARTGDIEIESRIASYELAFRMQAAAPELLDFSSESAATKEMYGIDTEPTRPFATNCLLARRMVERGVRFVMLAHASWDDHSEIDKKLKENCAITDQPTAALLKDLKQRGLLDSTLVVWAGEFGRTPMVELRNTTDASKAGRDHHPLAFSLWAAGGGVRGGQVIGRTDDLCMSVVEDPVHVHDLQATILHLAGFDHTRLTYRHLGRDFRLTDVGGRVVTKMLA